MIARIASIGSIVKTVGLKGEVKLLPGPDFWPGALNAGHLDLVSPGGEHRHVNVVKCRTKGNTFILKLSGMETIEDAERCVGDSVEVALEDIGSEDAPDRLRPFQTVGARVELKDGTVVGTVVDMLLGPQQDCLIVDNGSEQLIIPNVPEVVVEADIENGVFLIDPPDGLLDLRW